MTRQHLGRILYITPMAPWPAKSGASQRSNLLLRALRACAETDLLVIEQHGGLTQEAIQVLERDFRLVGHLAPKPRGLYWPWRVVRWLAPATVDKLAFNLGRRSIAYRPDPNISGWLRTRLTQKSYDLIVVRYASTAALAGIPANMPAIVDIDDLDSEVVRAKTLLPGLKLWQRQLFRWHLRQLQRIIPKVLNPYQHLWIASESDAPYVRTEGVSVLPNIPFDQSEVSPPPPSTQQVVLMVGSLFFKPNTEGVDRFVADIWPALHRAHPEARFRIIGAGMSDDCRKRWSAVPGVEAIGYAEDLAEHYAACAFTVAPIFRGGGTKIKVLESLLNARTCVTTAHGGRGYESGLRDGDSLLIADTNDRFISACNQLLEDLTLRNRLAARGHDVVKTQFNFGRFQRVVQDAVASVLDKP